MKNMKLVFTQVLGDWLSSLIYILYTLANILANILANVTF